MKPTEFEWFAGVAAELAEKTMNLKKEDIEQASFFYNSDVRWCIGRLMINGNNIYSCWIIPSKLLLKQARRWQKS